MSSADWLKGYELANDSIKRFHAEFPDGRLNTYPDHKLSDLEKGFVLIIGEAYRHHDDLSPSATGIAHGNVSQYPASLKRFYVEDTETSALARAIKTLSPSTMRPSVEEMNRVDYLTLVPEMPIGEVSIEVHKEPDPWTFGASIDQVTHEMSQPGAILDVQRCQHGAMAFKEGTGKTGAPYKGFVCTHKDREMQCPPRWQK